MPEPKAAIREALAADLPAIASYLAPRMRGRGGEGRYRRFFEYGWLADKPNLGFLIESGGQLRGFVGAIYARRPVRGREHLFCNINSWHVDEAFRNLSLRMMTALLARRDCTYTCFSPAQHVVEVLKFFKFQLLASEKVICPPVSGLARLLRAPRVRVFWGDGLESRLRDSELRIFQDHRSYRCGHFLVEGEERSYFVTVRRGGRARAFADVLYASNPDLLAECIAHTHVPVALTHATLLTGIDRRLLRRKPPGCFTYRGLRPLMFRSETVDARDIDTLYSEFAPMYG